MLLKKDKWIKVDIEGWTEEGREGGDILSRINLIPFGGVNMFLVSGLRPTTGVYI
jgi:hypothetical protein